ncbi:MAG: hypothetical protein NVS9B3_05570 [Gemmatimonadaceae bacterium]
MVHALLITGAAYGTMQAKEKLEKPKAEKVDFVEMKKDEPKPPPEKAPPPDVVAAPPPPKGFQTVVAPINVPDVIPDIDLTKKVTDEADFSGKGVVGGTSKGVEGGKAIKADQAYFDFQVEKVAAGYPSNPAPRYPDILQNAGVEGEVLAQFVVDTTGRAESGSFKVLKSTHELFTQSVRNALPQMRFYPADGGGRKVKQLVQQPFVFAQKK